MIDESTAPVGVIGGSGFYEFVDDATTVDVDTPFGRPSEPVVTGTVEGRPVAFIPRHGRDHRFPPHRVPYRANLWALRSVGVRQCWRRAQSGRCGPTSARAAWWFPTRWSTARSDESTRSTTPGPVVHVGFADPYCPNGRQAVIGVAAAQDWPAKDGGTLVVIQGPRFSSRAESRHHADQGWSIVGMTGQPEATLARELALCFTSIAVVTDLDAGVEAGQGVTHGEVLEVFAASVARLRSLLTGVIRTLPTQRTCACANALDGQTLPFPLP